MRTTLTALEKRAALLTSTVRVIPSLKLPIG